MNNQLCLLSQLIKKLKSEYNKYIQQALKPNINIKEIEKSQLIISKLIEIIQKNISSISNLQIQNLKEEQEKNHILNNKLILIENLKRKSISALTKNIPFYSRMLNSKKEIMQKNSNTSSTNNNFITNKITNKDLVNLTFRLSKQSTLPVQIQNNSLPYAYLQPYPNEDFQMQESILSFNLSERLPPPIIKPKGGIVPKETKLEIKSDTEKLKSFIPKGSINDVFFKYTITEENSYDGGNIPSYFSGELYDFSNEICIDRNCTIKVCCCKFGFMDSYIITNNYKISSESGLDNARNSIDFTSERKLDDVAVRPSVDILSDVHIVRRQRSSSFDNQLSPVSGSGSFLMRGQDPNCDNNSDDI